MGLKVTLQKVRINNGGYDSAGSYWGIGGSPLYCAIAEHVGAAEETYYFRARDRAHAKEIVRTNWKSRGRGLEGATFYN